jgi:hypothetical protein
MKLNKVFACLGIVSPLLVLSFMTVAVPKVVAVLTFFFGGGFVISSIVGLVAFLTGFALGVDTNPALTIAL